MSNTEHSTEEKIIAAAELEFQSKGYHGARMREIASRAGINKGLLHYYFKTKDRLFEAIFQKAFEMMVRKMNKIFSSDQTLSEKFESFLDTYLRFISMNPAIPRFVINELNRHPDTFVQKVLSGKDRPDIQNILKQIEEAMDKPDKSENAAIHLLMDIIAMCVFPFIAQPMLQGIIRMDDDHFQELMQERKSHIMGMISMSLNLKE